MELLIDAVAIRILGCLIEKEVTTPDYYPLSLNGLVNACNQKSNRDPIMQLSEEEVECGIDVLKEKHLVWKRSVAGARVFKYEHNFKSIIPVTTQEIAVLCVLMLRGAQTIGEIRLRTERLCTFSSIEETEKVVRQLIAREDGPFVIELPRQAGRKESRFMHLFCGKERALLFANSTDVAGEASIPVPGAKSAGERISDLETSVSQLQSELQALRHEFDALKQALE
jgi:uncharacterized protein